MSFSSFYTVWSLIIDATSNCLLRDFEIFWQNITVREIFVTISGDSLGPSVRSLDNCAIQKKTPGRNLHVFPIRQWGWQTLLPVHICRGSSAFVAAVKRKAYSRYFFLCAVTCQQGKPPMVKCPEPVTRCSAHQRHSPEQALPGIPWHRYTHHHYGLCKWLGDRG